ncbi:MAG TPA: glycosyltransferase [Pyrinomonadaceae bacterium]|nr:glycosyltransferase [Pyrinomonadaceae bacterium]
MLQTEVQQRRISQPLLEVLPAYETNLPTSFRLSVLVAVYNERHVVATSLRRVLALEDPLIKQLEVIVVDDRSTDGSWEVLQRLATQDSRIKLLRHESNQGKGAAIQTALVHATGDISIIHDADLECNPEDIPSLLVPFVKEGADAVFGSRFLSAPYRRALRNRHTLLNKSVTYFSNWLSDLYLTDVETCYKAIKTALFRSIPLRSKDFRFEVEITSKLAKRQACIFEVPIRYLPRSEQEGKKIRTSDGLLAIMAMIRFWLIDDLYQEDEYGSHIRTDLERARRINLWMGRVLRPFVGDRVLEIGAGIGTLVNQFIPRELYVASDKNPQYLNFLRSHSWGKPYLRVLPIDLSNPEDFEGLEQRFDTALVVNVLAQVADEQVALENIWRSLEPGGRVIIMVPQHPALYGTLDEALDHRERYTRAGLEKALTTAGFRIEKLFDFNRFSVLGWWLNGKVLRRKRFSRIQIKLVSTLMPLLRRSDRVWPWSGLSLIAIGVKD